MPNRTGAAAPPPTARSSRRCAAGAAGFSLVEILVASALGAILLLATANAAGAFAETAAHIQANATSEQAEALARVAAGVRTAWWVEIPGPNRLKVADLNGGVTEYYLDGDALKVRLPSGSEGVFTTGLADLLFEGQTVQRLREGRWRSVSDTVLDVPAPATPASGYTLSLGDQLALALTRGSNADLVLVTGFREQVIDFRPTSMQLRVATAKDTGNLHFEIHAARAPGDARPRAGSVAIAAGDVRLNTLPGAVPITDRFGTILGYQAPARDTIISIGAATGTGWFSSLRAGVAYTLVLSVDCTIPNACLVIQAHASAAGATGAVQSKAAADTAWTSQALVVPWSMVGDQTITGTDATDAVALVKTTLTPASGPVLVGSASVYTQVMAENPWTGVVPGETAPLP